MKKLKFLITFICLLFMVLVIYAQNPLQINRLNGGKPIIDQSHFEKNGIPNDGDNINGPCVIALPDWLPKEKRVNAKANYYMYFGHHQGTYIRMAWAEKITGSWHLYNADRNTRPSKRGVLSLFSDETKKKIVFENSVEILDHIASPIVTIDNEKKQFILFFHGPTKLTMEKKINQRTFVAFSADGIHFQNDIKPVMLGDSYFAPFVYKSRYFAFSNRGIFQAAPPKDAFYEVPFGFDFSKVLWSSRNDFFRDAILKTGNPIFRVRHLSTYLDKDILHILFSSCFDTPEQIYYCTVRLDSGTSKDWKSNEFICVMRAKEVWEGGNLAPVMSEDGSAKTMINEVRDPYIFKDTDGRYYLFYCAGGERGIGIASLKFKNDFKLK